MTTTVSVSNDQSKTGAESRVSNLCWELLRNARYERCVWAHVLSCILVLIVITVKSVSQFVKVGNFRSDTNLI